MVFKAPNMRTNHRISISIFISRLFLFHFKGAVWFVILKPAAYVFYIDKTFPFPDALWKKGICGMHHEFLLSEGLRSLFP